MPSRNSIKQYVENSYYHVYNRGVEKRNIFQDDQDYRVFLHLLKFYLSKGEDSQTSSLHPLTELTGFIPVRKRPLAKLGNKVELHAFCLMPNHFHLLLKQIDNLGIQSLLRRLSTTYAMYFNNRYNRVGHLFQGIYKAVLVKNDEYLLHLSRYIHLNPQKLTNTDLSAYPYSSFAYYLGGKNSDWLKTDFILDYFRKTSKKEFSDYRSFVESSFQRPEEILGSLVIEND